jgi:hypothetical protein
MGKLTHQTSRDATVLGSQRTIVSRHRAGCRTRTARIMPTTNSVMRPAMAAAGLALLVSACAPTQDTTSPREAFPTANTTRPTAPNPSPDEQARTERVQDWARELLAKPYAGAPFACTDEGWTSADNYVVELAPWAEAAGLRRGDRIIEFGGILLAHYDAPGEAWSKVARSERITIRVERGSREVSIQLPCRDDAAAWHARNTILQAVASGQWQGCIDGIRAFAMVSQMTSASALRITCECMRERAKATRERLPDEYWRTLHAWAIKAIEESRYRPTGLTEIRDSLLGAADALEKAGQTIWAKDIKWQSAPLDGTSTTR